MKLVLPTLFRAILVFAIFCGVQYFFHYSVVTIGGILAGIFFYTTSYDRPLALGLLIGSIVFGIFAYAMAQIYPI